jgi:peroxiredoxin
MIVVIVRGQFCPKDHQQLLELAAFYPKIIVGYSQMVTISTDDVFEISDLRASVGAQWTFLSDAGRRLQKDLDIQEYTDSHNDPMIPYTFVLKPRLIIHSCYNGYWYWGRPSIAELQRDLRQVTQEIRPDWDLGTPGLRENWETGDRSLHYRYRDADLGQKVA